MYMHQGQSVGVTWIFFTGLIAPFKGIQNFRGSFRDGATRKLTWLKKEKKRKEKKGFVLVLNREDCLIVQIFSN